MIHKLYSVYDQKAELYDVPKAFRAVGEALRAFSAAVNKPDHPYAQHPGDYHFFEIGEYDDSKGIMTPYEIPTRLGCALEFVDKFSAPQRPYLQDGTQNMEGITKQ